ncbi:GATA transcription factor 11 [Linum perenne]
MQEKRVRLEDVELADEELDWRTKFQDLDPPSVFLPNFSYDMCGAAGTKDAIQVDGTSSALQKESFQLKQCSPNTEEGSSSRSINIQCDSSEGNHSQHFRTSSPISVLESSSSSCSAQNPTTNHPEIAIAAKRPRSKGLRSQRRTYELFNPSFTGRMLHPLGQVQSECDTDLNIDEKTPSLAKDNRRRKKKNLEVASCNVEVNKRKQASETKKCSHCLVTETPQWREGPLGPKTLRNACGVRHRSGRLFPEYRPAASPTFSPSLHSNSHKKVLEMIKRSFTGCSGQETSTTSSMA